VKADIPSGKPSQDISYKNPLSKEAPLNAMYPLWDYLLLSKNYAHPSVIRY